MSPPSQRFWALIGAPPDYAGGGMIGVVEGATVAGVPWLPDGAGAVVGWPAALGAAVVVGAALAGAAPGAGAGVPVPTGVP